MTEHVASRTLVKSPPELWAECSDAGSLARHLDQFGEIRITRLDPETAVAWEGERARGTVRIEPAGWGTKVILTAVAEEELVSAEPETPEAPGPVFAVPEPRGESGPVFAKAEPLGKPEPPGADETPEEPYPDPVAPTEPVEAIEPSMDVPARRRRFARLFGFFRAPPSEPVLLVEPAAVEQPPTEPGPATEPEVRPKPRPQPEPELELKPESAPQPEPEPAPEPEPLATEAHATEAALTAALDSLGQAHHRPYSRA
jgi:hypothetical protein